MRAGDVLIGAFCAALVGCALIDGAIERSRKASPQPQPCPSNEWPPFGCGTPEERARLIDEHQARDKTQHEARERTRAWAQGECLSHGGVPVLGFDWKTTCILSPLFDSWVIGGDDPPGVKRHLDGVIWIFVGLPDGKPHCFTGLLGEPWAPAVEKPCP